MTPNKEQEKAINTIHGPVILVSCPGSGKTTTLLRRILNMIQNGVHPDKILMITFTKAAADEMKKKYHEFGGKMGVTFSTIHALCLRILLNFGGYTAEDILKESDAKFFLLNIAKKDYKINDPNKAVALFMTQYSAARNNGISINDVIPEGISKESFTYMAQRYAAFKKENHKIDFDDMLLEAYELMLANNNVLEFLQNKWTYVQVDEYQDVNNIQKEFIYLLVKKSNNICVAGDDDQSIYGFRGAKPEIMMNFTNDFENAKLINISTNYRSLPEIINKAGCLIKNNKNRLEKEFLAGRTGNAEIYYEKEKNLKTEIQSLVRSINESTVNHNDIAVLYRNNSQAELIANAFYKNNIPFVSTEKIPDSYESWIWSDIMAYYRLSRETGSEYDLQRIIDRPNRYLSKIFRCAAEKSKNGLFQEASKISENWQRKNALKAIDKLYLDLAALKNKNPYDFLMYILNNMGYRFYIKNYCESTNQDFAVFESTLEIYKTDGQKFKNMDEWQEYIKRRTFALKSMKKEGITLSTMHRAKGLEWNCVYIIDCNEDIIPSKKCRTANDIEEERRLFYVAVTRAKDQLHLMYIKRGNNEEKESSRFLRELKKSNEYKNGDKGFRKDDLVKHKTLGICIILEVFDDRCKVKSLKTGKEHLVLNDYFVK